MAEKYVVYTNIHNNLLQKKILLRKNAKKDLYKML